MMVQSAFALKEVEEVEADLVEQRPCLHVPGLEAVGVDALINIPLPAQRLGDLEGSGNKTDEFAINLLVCI